jgi:translation initiation factor IF-3
LTTICLSDIEHEISSNRILNCTMLVLVSLSSQTTMQLRGREVEHPEFGQKVLENFKDQLSDISTVESTSQPDGRSITMVLAPLGGKK